MINKDYRKMLKIIRHEFSRNRFLNPFAIFYMHYPEQVKSTQEDLVCKKCLNYQVSVNRFSSVFVTQNNPMKDISCLFSIKSCQEPVINQVPVPENVIGKQFVENESIYHHTVLEKSSEYSSTIYRSDCKFAEKYTITDKEYDELMRLKDWEIKSPDHVFKAFVSLGVYSASNLKLTIDDERFNELTLAFVDKCSSFTDEQLIDCLIALQIWPQSINVRENNFCQIWKTLDSVCLQRQLDWTIDKMLYMFDLWYCIKLIRLSNFVYKGLNRISRKCHDLTGAQMIQLMFYMSCIRNLHPCVSMREYEYYLQKHITHLTIEEIGIFALAFFKTKTSILNQKLLLYTMQRVAQEINTINVVTLTAIAKAIRFSFKVDLALTTNDLVKKITEQRMDSLNLVCAIHIGHITTKVQFFNEEAVTKLAEMFCANPSEARLKDIERITLILSMFNYIPPTTPDIVDLIVEQLNLPHHVKAGEMYPLTLASLVYFLTLLKTYPEKQIKLLLSEESLKKHYENKFLIPLQLLQIDYNRVLEGSPGSEHLMSPSLREYVARRNSKYPPDIKFKKLTHFDKMVLDVNDLTKKVLGGEEYYLVSYTLPHYPRSDILFRLDSEGRPVPIPEEFRSKPLFEDVVRPEGDGWHCVVIANRNMYMYNKPQMVGEGIAKLRQLRLLGYTPIVIPDHYWYTEKNKAEYLKLKYFSTPR